MAGSKFILTPEGAHTWATRIEESSSEIIVLQGIAPVLIIFAVVVWVADRGALGATLLALGALLPIWLPVYLGRIFFVSWIDFVRFKFWLNQRYTILEVELPPDVQKSPLAMEVFLSTLWNSGGESTWFDRWYYGKSRALWSLEIVSNEGHISYCLRVPKAWKTIIESRLYGQFPEARIREINDYVDKIDFSLNEYDLFGIEYAKSSPQALPIKTYIQYELDKNTDSPETRVDPLTHVLELFGNLGEGEYAWLQIIIKAHKKEEWHGVYKLSDSYRSDAAGEIGKVMKQSMSRAEKIGQQYPATSEGEKMRMANIEHSLTKLTFDCGIRSLYFARKDHFKPPNIQGLVNLFAPLRGSDTKGEYNALSIANRGLAVFSYPWQDFRNLRQDREKKLLWHRYKHRAYFNVPYNQIPVYMSTEELATIWRFPNASVSVPGLERVPSRLSDAPPNLPI